MKVFSLILLFSILFIGCASTEEKKDETPVIRATQNDYTESAAKYMPLAVGNKWLYAVDYIGNKGEMEIAVTGEKDGFYTDNHGGALKVDKRGIRDKERYLLMFPLNENREWSSILGIGRKEVRKIVNIDQDVTTPAGKFEGTIVVETESEPEKGLVLKSLTYFAVNVGIVKIETMLLDSSKGTLSPQTTTELKSFTKIK